MAGVVPAVTSVLLKVQQQNRFALPVVPALRQDPITDAGCERDSGCSAV
jgi:hypothetical protein